PGSHADPSRRGRRDPPEHGHRGRTRTATIGRRAGPGCASLTRATRLTGATRLHVARIRPKAASGVARGSVATRAQGPARTWPQGAHTGTATIGRRAGPRVRFAYPGYAAYRGDATPRSPDKAEGRIRVARGSAATRAQGPARTLPQGAHTGNATIGPH